MRLFALIVQLSVSFLFEITICWVHEGRHYKKLSPVVACHQVILGQFIEDFWDYYRELLAEKNAPSAEAARQLKSKYWLLFTTPSGDKSIGVASGF